MTLFRGAYVALITPFKDNGKIDRQALQKLVAWQVAQGTDGILCCGATGEGIVLTESEKREVATLCVEATEKKIPVVVSVGTASTSQTARSIEQMQKLGAAGCMVVTPYYNRPSERGCLAHYGEAVKVGTPIVAYYNPARTGLRLTPESLAKIGEIEGVVALKDSSGDVAFLRKLRKLSKLPVFAGDDDQTLEAIREGSVGAISVIGNLLPKQWKEMIDLALEKKWEATKRLHERYLPLCRALFLETNPQCVKWAAYWFGLAPDLLRLPLVEPEEATKRAIRQVVMQLALPHMRRDSHLRNANVPE